MTPQEKKALLVIIFLLAVGYGSKGLTKLGVKTYNPPPVAQASLQDQEPLVNEFSKGSAAPRHPAVPEMIDSLHPNPLQPTLSSTLSPSTHPPTVQKNKSPKPSPAFPIPLNTASKSQLIHIKGIGPKTAEKIIRFRKENGPFKSLKGLLKIKGIGPKKLKKITPHLTLD